MLDRKEFMKRVLLGSAYICSGGNVYANRVNDKVNEFRVYTLPEKEIERILKKVKYPNGPTPFAGRLYENDEVKIFEKDRRSITRAEGIASYYSRKEGFKITATGAPFYDNEFTAAVNERLGLRLPFLGRIIAVNPGTDDKLIGAEAVFTNHGPYKINEYGTVIKRNGIYIPHETRIVDLTPRLADVLKFKEKGLAKVIFEYIRDLSHLGS